jgi:hypothetical protein
VTDLIEKRRNKAQDIHEGGRRQKTCGYEACGEGAGNRFLFKKAKKVKGNSGPLTAPVGPKTMNNKVIAHASLFAQCPGEERFEITVEIGTPYQCGEDPEEWACPVAVRPPYKRLHDAHGGDSLTYENGESFPPESYSFGVAKRR